jgi:hypothetical protein
MRLYEIGDIKDYAAQKRAFDLHLLIVKDTSSYLGGRSAEQRGQQQGQRVQGEGLIQPVCVCVCVCTCAHVCVCVFVCV